MFQIMNVLSFCNIPLADTMTNLKPLLLLWHNCDVNCQHIMSHFCSVWRHSGAYSMHIICTYFSNIFLYVTS